VRYQALKILVAGLISALSLGLSAAIEKLLQAIPGLQPVMMFPLPGSRGQTISDAIAAVVSGIIGGMLSTIAIYFMDKFRDRNKQMDIRFKLVAAEGIATQYKLVQTWIAVDEAYKYTSRVHERDIRTVVDAAAAVDETLNRPDIGLNKLRIAKERVEKLGGGK
jgi:hypothetical protein